MALAQKCAGAVCFGALIAGEQKIDFEQGLERLRKLALFAQIAAIVVAVTSASSAISVAVYLNDAWPDELIGTADYHGLDRVVDFDAVALLSSWFVVGAWIYRAHANLQLTDVPSTEFTPGWAIGWFAVPIANLFKPFQAMKALWRISHLENPDTDKTAPGILWFWWIAWVLSSLGSFGTEYTSLDVVAYAMTSMSAIFLVFIIRQITGAQPSMSVAGTFE